MRVTLQRTIDVRRLHIKAAVRVAETRRVHVAVLAWVKERLAAGQLASAAAMVEPGGLLPGRPRVLAARLLLANHAVGVLQLADAPLEDCAAIAVTAQGDKALVSQLIEVPREDVGLEVLYAEDPLLPHSLLRVKAATPSAYEETQTQRDRSKPQQKGRRVSLPPGLLALCGPLHKPLLPEAGYSELAFESMNPQGVAYESVLLHLQLSLADGQEPDLRLMGSTDGGKRSQVDALLPLPPEATRGGWSCEALLRDLGLWNGHRHRVPLPFAGLTPEERRSLTADLPVLAYTTAAGALRASSSEDSLARPLDARTFEPSKIRNVPIGPESDEDAESWLRWLLAATTSDYETPATFYTRAEQQRRRFPGYISKLDLPTQWAFAHALRAPDRQPAAYFFLQAPLDLPFGDGGQP